MGKNMSIVYQPNPNDTGDCGTFYGLTKKPAAGATQYVITASMAPADLHDTANQLYLVIEAANDPLGEAFVPVAKSPVWQGAPNAVAPSLTWLFPVNQNGNTQTVILPTGVRAKLVNGVAGTGTQGAPAVTLTDNL